ncbi:hypothetical protein CAAN1_03S01090 [[Candida] anglica]|uniref:Peroxin/Ferlin domain-containing protein n=1 Tax=[Candida] anglica TaxID=148631 RepID=A0ABP0EKW9_9ASCO
MENESVNEIYPKFENFPQIKGFRELFSKNNDNSYNNDSLTTAILSEYRRNSKVNTPKNEIIGKDIDFEFIIENQRGLKFFGIPLFSSKPLIPIVDPPNFQSLNGNSILNAVELRNDSIHTTLTNIYPLPDLNWEWTWDTWYVVMLYDVDDQGWIYSGLLFNSKHWKGKYYFGNFVRRRIWARLRNRIGYKVNGFQTDNDRDDQKSDLVVSSNEIEYNDGDKIYVGKGT